VLGAPYTDEIKRKNYESHFPFWFDYSRANTKTDSIKPAVLRSFYVPVTIVFMVLLLVVALIYVINIIPSGKDSAGRSFHDDFNSVTEDSLIRKGWYLKDPDTLWWDKRGEQEGHLALFTLRGDNWPLGGDVARIRNLLLHKISSDCFSVEVHLANFRPEQNWQQAGIILCEDTNVKGSMIRLSISFNDYFGGFNELPEILIQGLSSVVSGSTSSPEEFIHKTLFSVERNNSGLIKTNLIGSALKIEKTDGKFHFLYSLSNGVTFAYQEILSRDFNFRPKYAGIFSIGGWANPKPIPAYFDYFNLNSLPCSK
jgi:hypothetical protein